MPIWFLEPLAVGDSGREVDIVRRKLGMIHGAYDSDLASAVRAFQRGARLPVTGVVDERTADALGEREGFGLLPPWWPGKDFGPTNVVWAEHVERIMGHGYRGDDLKRFQATNRLQPTGRVDETTARLLYGLDD